MDSTISSSTSTTEQGKTITTNCCIVGGGPAGTILAHLLARQGIPVVLLEGHKTFDREYRADTIHPSTLELLDQLGIVDGLFDIRHTKMHNMKFILDGGKRSVVMSNFAHLRTKYPYLMIISQTRFLQYMTEKSLKYPSFQILMGARVEQLIEEEGVVRGVRYRADDGIHEVRAYLTVGCDGRFSRTRQAAALEMEQISPPLEILWFKLPRREGDPDAAGALHFAPGQFSFLLDRDDFWQVSLAIKPGTYSQVRALGIEHIRAVLPTIVPWLADRVDTLQDWKQLTLLSVGGARLKRWYVPGLLFIGDAAHVMNPVGGFGINLAIQDAVATANHLTKKLKVGQVSTNDLAKVQKERELSTVVAQKVQKMLQKRIHTDALDATKPFSVPLFNRISQRIPILRSMHANLVCFGLHYTRFKQE